MAKKRKTYETINRPYDALLKREGVSDNPFDSNNTSTPNADSNGAVGSLSLSGGISDGGSSGNGSVESASVHNGGNLQDIWIHNFIRSDKWKPKSQGFYIDGRTGKAEFMGVYISGEIEALTGKIGGFTITDTSLTVSSGGNTTLVSSRDMAFATGPTNAPTFAVSQSGHMISTSALIGGCLVQDSSISTVNFEEGAFGHGWSINSNGKAEFQDIIVRGVLKTSVFEKDTISAVNGQVIISSADVLDSDMTALDSSTLTIKGATTFSVDEVIRLKDGYNDEWLLVTDASNAPTYTVNRDLASNYASDNNPAWTKGVAVVSMGVGAGNKTGFISMDSSSDNSPYIDIYGRNSVAYLDYTRHARIGWLKGVTDTDVGLNNTDAWGVYTDNAYIKGVVVAETGKIGGSFGWDITSGLISSVNGTNTTNLSSGGTYALEAGPTGSPAFTLTHEGVLNATSGSFSGDITGASGTFSGDLEANSIEIGTNGWHVDSSGNMWWGSSSNYAGATIKISNTGSVNFTTGSFSGTLNAPSGTLGTISGGTIIGGTIKTGTTGDITQMDSNNLKFYHGNTFKGLLRPDSAKSMLLGTASSFYIGDLSGNYNLEITSGGSIHILNSGQNIRFNSGTQFSEYSNGLQLSGGFYPSSDGTSLGKDGRRWNLVGHNININNDFYASGDIRNGGDIRCGGKFKSSDGSGGDTTNYTVVTWIDHGAGKFYTHDMRFKDGLFTGDSGEDSHSL